MVTVIGGGRSHSGCEEPGLLTACSTSYYSICTSSACPLVECWLFPRIRGLGRKISENHSSPALF